MRKKQDEINKLIYKILCDLASNSSNYSEALNVALWELQGLLPPPQRKDER